MHARVTTIQGDPDRLDDVVTKVESEEVPQWREIDGFKGFTLVVDRTSGKAIGTSYWESEEQMNASEEQLRAARERVAEEAGSSGSPQVELYEVAIDTFEK